jgi:hypothetical protein
VGYFAPLKQAYKEEIRVLVNCFINYIDKKAFLDAYKKVHERVFLSNNIILSFRATSLVLDNVEVVLSKLDAKPRTLTLLALGPTAWHPKILSNAWEIEAQTTLIMKRIRAYKSSSPELIIEMVLQAKKGSVIKVHANILLEARVAALEQANNAASERKKRKKRRI